MGKILMEYYRFVDNQFGLKGKIELAKITKTSSIMAGAISDSEEMINKFKEAIKKISNQLSANIK